MQITPIPCLNDNYAYIIYDNLSKKVGIVDPSEAKPIIDFLNKKKIKLDFILNTHHHYDHIGGNIELKKLYKAKVIGFLGDKHRIPGIDISLKDNEIWMFGESKVKILHIPGHTLGHICFFFEKEKIAFTGDTLFSLGCGRIFEGDHKQMLSSLNRIKKLPLDTKIYCGHEYT
jgi:hydroxyacylglutathione hydrolase